MEKLEEAMDRTKTSGNIGEFYEMRTGKLQMIFEKVPYR